jgi:hypothetical protein
MGEPEETTTGDRIRSIMGPLNKIEFAEELGSYKSNFS